MVAVNFALVLQRRHVPSGRGAISVVEVMFAMMVAVIGLLGIASVLPLAARNARESNNFNFVHAAANTWFQEFSTRELNNYSGWKALQDYQVGTVDPQFVSFTSLTRIPFPHSTAVTPTYSTVTNQAINRMWAHQAICIDPYFYTDPIVASDVATAVTSATIPFTANHLAYRPSVFPYYQDGHNPVTDAFAPALPWPDQPRMIRVTLDAPMAPAGKLRQVNREFAQNLFTANDDFSTYVDEKQSDVPAIRLFSTLAAPATGFAKAVSDRKYSWMATLTPREPLPSAITSMTVSEVETDYSLSIVIFEGRDLSWIDPAGVTLGNTTPGIAENKPAGERLVWVYPLSGDFIGGNGGRVRLITNEAVDDRLSIGDWIMLGKHYAVDPGNPLNRFAYFRWYRIVAVDAEAQRGRLAIDRDGDGVGEIVDAQEDPWGNAAGTQVWSRDVVLEGPDWSFGGPMSRLPTTGTLMKNVITVIDRSTIIP